MGRVVTAELSVTTCDFSPTLHCKVERKTVVIFVVPAVPGHYRRDIIKAIVGNSARYYVTA